MRVRVRKEIAREEGEEREGLYLNGRTGTVGWGMKLFRRCVWRTGINSP